MHTQRALKARPTGAAHGILLWLAAGAQVALGQGPASPTPTPTPIPPMCVGDCNRDGVVTVDDLITMVAVTLHEASSVACSAGNDNDGNEIHIREIVTAVNAALNGCAATRWTPTPTATPVPSPTPTSPAVCGDKRWICEPPEQCDDGNLIDGDGCDSHCRVEPGFQCSGEPSMCIVVSVCLLPNVTCSVVPTISGPTPTPTPRPPCTP
jgi:cysteine-rich repeat protein